MSDDKAKDAPAARSKLREQRPGAMGLGTSEAVPKKPEGWVPPKKPDLMTRSTKPRGGR